MGVPEIFGSMVFNEQVMAQRLPEETYRALKRTIEEGKRLDISLASVIAAAMKDWAIEKGVTHYTHWFQPMTGVTAEKHDSFLSPTSDGRIIMEFSGKELVKGESDASSFPSGGLRATFEARGYTAWDPTSYAFIKENTLYIPTAFFSYGGESLDKKTPLMRSMEFLSKQTLRILRLFGMEDVKKVTVDVGAEQEYFLIDKEKYKKRKDLVYTGRTLFGAMPPKGQELDDHYFGAIRPRVKAFMKALDEELWKLGVYAKTEHNEAAPSQHELAPIFCSANLATDQNQLMMETMKKVADKFDLACILHEKPFEGVNGSGKHNNWSLSTNTGENLFNPGQSPSQNLRFMLFLTAVIKAVDEYQDLLRISVASAGNDHRLGASEAPPAIISIYLGDELNGVIDSILDGKVTESAEPSVLGIGVHVLPKLPKDTTDRNRTSPMAFTGKKFEFRMPGSSFSLAGPNTILNTAFASVISGFADELEAAEDFEKAASALIRRELGLHRRILFSGNNYSDSWVAEAEKRGLSNYRTADEAIGHLLDEKNIRLLTENKIYNESELRSRTSILLEAYYKKVLIEAKTMTDMVRHEIYPASVAYRTALLKANGEGDYCCKADARLCRKLCELTDALYSQNEKLEEDIEDEAGICGEPNADILALDKERAAYCRKTLLPQMVALRRTADELERITAKEYLPFPTYGDMLFEV